MRDQAYLTCLLLVIGSLLPGHTRAQPRRHLVEDIGPAETGRRIDYGPETQGPYFKAGLYQGDFRTDHATRDLVYLDAYRPGGPGATCTDVVPGPARCSGTPTSKAEHQDLERMRVGGDAYDVRWLATEDFSNSDWGERWTVESGAEGKAPARVWVEDGRLHVDDPATSEGVTLWHAQPVPADFVLRYRVHLYEDSPEGTFVVFAAAREPGGAPLRVGARDGNYETYQAHSGRGIRAYLASLTLGHARLRRLPDFSPPLESNEEASSRRGTTHEVVLAVHDGRVRFYLDGTKRYDHALDEPLPGGHVALRNWHTRAWWDDVAFGEVAAPEPLPRDPERP